MNRAQNDDPETIVPAPAPHKQRPDSERPIDRVVMADDARILSITENEVDPYGDWLVGAAVCRFKAGISGMPYTHVQIEREVLEAELIEFQDGSPGVMLGEQIHAP